MLITNDNIELKNEIWKDIIGFEGEYMISNYRRVKSFKGSLPIILKSTYFYEDKTGKLIKGNIERVILHSNGKSATYKTKDLYYNAFFKGENLRSKLAPKKDPKPKKKTGLTESELNELERAMNSPEWIEMRAKEKAEFELKENIVFWIKAILIISIFVIPTIYEIAKNIL